MQAAVDQFRANIGYVRNLGALHSNLKSRTTSVLDLSDILRAQLVLAISALDHFVHEIVRIGMLESYHGRRAKTEAFLKFSISVDSLFKTIQFPNQDSWFDSEIRTKHSWQSFQHSDKIADAVRLISEKKIWEEVSRAMGRNAADVKRELNLVVERRNKIAHEADMDPTFPGKKWPIDEAMVNGAILFVEQIVERVFLVL